MLRSMNVVAVLLAMFFWVPIHSTNVGVDDALIYQLKRSHIRLIVLRNGQTTQHFTGAINSSLSPGIYLTELGEQQAYNAASLLQDEEIDAIYVSPLYRCLQTTQLIAKTLDFPHDKIYVSLKLREQNFGVFEGATYNEFNDAFPTKQDMFLAPIHEGESGAEVYERCHNIVWRIALEHHNATVLLVTHALNCCQINKFLTGVWGTFLPPAGFQVYDYQD